MTLYFQQPARYTYILSTVEHSTRGVETSAFIGRDCCPRPKGRGYSPSLQAGDSKTTSNGLCAYGKSSAEALEQLDEVKETAFELMLSQGEEPPQPKVRLEIPENVFRKIPGRKILKQYVKA